MPEIVKGIKSHFTDLFDRKSTKNNDQCTQFLRGLNIPRLSAEHKEFLKQTQSCQLYNKMWLFNHFRFLSSISDIKDWVDNLLAFDVQLIDF